MTRRKTTEEFIQEAKRIHGGKYNYDQVVYVGSYNKVKIFCNKCKRYFEQTPSLHTNNKCGCPYCVGKNINTEIFIEKAQKIHGEIYDYKESKYEKCRAKIKIYCKKCGKFFYQAPEDHLDGKGCPYCKQSKGEKSITNWLIKNKIKFETQKRFQNCKDKKPLPFDFYLPNHNLCIEHQGEQHFFEKERFQKNNQSNFMVLQKHDQIKRIFCKENHIKLLEITYKDNIEDKLRGCNF